MQAATLLAYIKSTLEAAQVFLGGTLPVKHYAFLFLFSDRNSQVSGAWEHSYSSEYVLNEEPLTPAFAASISNMVAHEFFHIVTPLNIHSEVIAHFNFVHPVASEHLWFYEGVTEWAAYAMQLRAGLISIDQYLAILHRETLADRTQFDTTYTLSRLGLNAYSEEGQQQYANVYQRGALTATLLDLRLLELSHGTRGLREVILQLEKQYGPNRPFREAHFFEDFTVLTYPEIWDFFRRYVQGAEPLPFEAYFSPIGINFVSTWNTGKQQATLGPAVFGRRENGMLFLKQVSTLLEKAGVAVNDDVLAIDGVPSRTFAVSSISDRAPGSVIVLTIQHPGSPVQEVPINLDSVEEVQRFAFIPNPDATAVQLSARALWIRNL